MKTPFIPRISPDKAFQAIGYNISVKIVYAILLGIGLAMFGHGLLVVLGHLLHLLIEIIESMVEHLLEWLFNLSPRQAEMITFWLGFAILLGVARPVSIKIYAAVKNSFLSWLAKPKFDKYILFIQFVVLSTTLALFY
ncbi:MAG: hypothetical protein NTV00_08385 [Methylococcales bacterium]|nr:hypothetical protein [Methylococcales bacterium]